MSPAAAENCIHTNLSGQAEFQADYTWYGIADTGKTQCLRKLDKISTNEDKEAMASPSLDVELLLEETFVAQVEHHLSLGSTNDRARECSSDQTVRLPLLVVADEQTAGRGRGSNRWWTGSDSLAVSLLVDPSELSIDRGRRPLLALAAGVAIVQTVKPLLGPRVVGLHWPNDVFVEGRKLAGVLVEVLSDRRCIVGMGLNTNNSLQEAPPELRETATTLLELTGIRHQRTTILVALLRHLDELFRRMSSAPGEIAARADALCLQHGQTVTVRLGGSSTTGVCRGIGRDGALLLDTPEGRREFYSGVLS